MTSLNALLKRADTVYGYSEDDKVLLRALAKEDPLGLMIALESDPLIEQGMPIAGPETGQGSSQGMSGISSLGLDNLNGSTGLRRKL
jgi:hypothetical protein